MTVLPQENSTTGGDEDQAENPLSIGTFSSNQDSSENFGDWRLVSAHCSGAVLLWQPHAEESLSLLSRLQPEHGPCWYERPEDKALNRLPALQAWPKQRSCIVLWPHPTLPCCLQVSAMLHGLH